MDSSVSRIIFSCFVLSGPAPVDYCANSFCAAGVKNVGCDPPPLTGGPDCAGKSFQIYDLGQAQQDTILNRINKQRNLFASGVAAPNFPKAKRMLQVTWDAELASQAGHKARTCNYPHDACRNTAKYSNVGQAIRGGGASGLDKDSLLTGFITSVSIINYRKTSVADDWTVVFNDKMIAVGCAMVGYIEPFGHMPYGMLVCNFSDGGILNEPWYASGEPASGCKTGPDSTYTSLCSSAEVL